MSYLYDLYDLYLYNIDPYKVPFQEAGMHKCQICQKSFHHWNSLKAHELVHTGSKVNYRQHKQSSRQYTPKASICSPLSPSFSPPSPNSPNSPPIPPPVCLGSTPRQRWARQQRGSAAVGPRTSPKSRRPSPKDRGVLRLTDRLGETPTRTTRGMVYSSSVRPGRQICQKCGKCYSSKTKLRMHQMKKHSRELRLLVYI